MSNKRGLWVLTSKQNIYSDQKPPHNHWWSSMWQLQLLQLWGCRCKPVNTPITLLAKEVLMSVARPRSPIFTEPVGPVMKMLSHFKSRCTMGGVRVCRKCRPFRICLHQLRNTFGFMTLKRLRYLWSTQPEQLVITDLTIYSDWNRSYYSSLFTSCYILYFLKKKKN